MKYKVGDLVYFDDGVQKGVGKIVSVQKSFMKYYLVHSTQIVDGHDGTNDVHRQDNKNNWWFSEDDLKPFTKKVGQKYKVISDRASRVESGELVTFIYDWGDSISTYEQENGRKTWLYDLEHSKCDVEFYEDAEEHKENEMFTKEDLKVGYLVKTRYGELAHVVNTINNGMCFNFGHGWAQLSAYEENLISASEHDYGIDIVEVYGYTHYGLNSHKFEIGRRKLLWKREEVKEMTIEEIQKVLGHKIKVVE